MSPKLFNFLLIILPVVIYLGYLKPAYTGEAGLVWTPTNSIVSLQSQKVQYEDSLNGIDLIEKEVMALSSDYTAVNPLEKDKIEIMLPDSIDQIKLRNEIILIAANSNIALQNLQVEKDLRGDRGLGFYSVSFDMKARYPVFKKFMEKYEKSMRFYILEKASIERQVKDEASQTPIDDEDALLINVASRVYFMNPK